MPSPTPLTSLPRRLVLAIATLAAFAAATATPALATDPGTSVVLDQPSGFTDPLTGAGNFNLPRSGGAASADGHYVAFASASDGLSATDDDALLNVFRKDRQTGALELVSVSSTGQPANGDSYAVGISDDGNRVLFMSEATNLDGDAADGQTHGFVRDVAAGTTTFVTRGQGPLGPPGVSFDGALSGDGRSAAFVTRDKMQLADDNGVFDVYVRRIAAGDTVLVSRPDGASTAAPGPSVEPAINYDGTRVAFRSQAKLEAADGNAYDDVYRRNTGDATTDLISARDADGKSGNGLSVSPAISASGDTVAYSSQVADMDKELPGTANGRFDVFVRDAGDQRNVSVGLYPGADATSREPDVAGESGAALRVAFTTVVTPPQGLETSQVAVRAMSSRATEIVSRTGTDGPLGDGYSNGASISASGEVVTFATTAQNLGGGIGGDSTDIVARDLRTGDMGIVSAPAGGPLAEDLDEVEVRAGRSQLSPDGRYAVFSAGHDGLGVADRSQHVFWRDRRTGRTLLVDRADGAAGAVATRASRPSVSADGRLVAFMTVDPLDPADDNAEYDVYVRDVVAGTTRLVSRTPAGGAADAGSFDPMISADGSRVAFLSYATNLGDGDSDNQADVHVRVLATGVTLLASRAADPANQGAYDGVISADGTRVAFESAASNLDPNDTDAFTDVFVRDLAAGTTRLVSRATGGVKGNLASYNPSISADGNRVAFESEATNLGDDLDGPRDVFVRDLAAGTTVLASRDDGPGGATADARAIDAAISADGTTVLFRSDAANLGGKPGWVFVRRLDDATTSALAAGRPAGLSADGSCAMFSSDDPLLLRSAHDFARVFVVALRSTCDLSEDRGDGGQGGAPGGGDGGGQQGGTPDAAPRLTGVSLLRTRFQVGRLRAGRGTAVRFSLSEPAAVTLGVQRRKAGRLLPRGVLRRAGAEGRNRVAFAGRIRGRALAPGRYRLTVRARDAAGNLSAPVRVGFRVKAG